MSISNVEEVKCRIDRREFTAVERAEIYRIGIKNGSLTVDFIRDCEGLSDRSDKAK